MTTHDHLQKLIGDYYVIAGLASAALVELITCDNDEQCETHARALLNLFQGQNQAIDDLREYAADAKVLGRDNFYQFVELPMTEGRLGDLGGGA